MTKECKIMTQEELDTLLNACQASPCIKMGNVDMGKSAQENANDYWKILADKYGNVIEGYVARDRSGFLLFFKNEPFRDRDLGTWNDNDLGAFNGFPIEMFPNLKWEDKPIKVDLSVSIVE